MNLNDGIAYDSWRTSYPAYWDEPEVDEAEPFELHEYFDFGGLRYLLTGEYSGDNLENATLYLITPWGLIEQDPGITDHLYADGYHPDRSTGFSITDQCYAIAEAGYEAATEAA